MGNWLDAIHQYTMFALAAFTGVLIVKLVIAQLPDTVPGASVAHSLASI